MLNLALMKSHGRLHNKPNSYYIVLMIGWLRPMLRFTLRDSQDDCQSTVHRNYRKKPTVSEIICVVRGFVWAKHVQVLNKSSPRPNSFSSLAFGLVSFLCAKEPPLRHLYCATTVHGSFSLDNWLHYSNVKFVPWYFCPSRVASFSYFFSLHPITKNLNPWLYQFRLHSSVPYCGDGFSLQNIVAWMHGILCMVAKKEHRSYRVFPGPLNS